jgi:hypothetical protein
LVGPFLQWMECPIPPDYCQGHRPATNFLTAAGGFMQAVLYGFLGLRYNDANMTILAPTLALNASSMAVHGLNYRGSQLAVEWNSASASVVCMGGCDSNQCAGAATRVGGVQKLSPGASTHFLAGTTIVVAVCSAHEGAA